jgi:hypothetical protein
MNGKIKKDIEILQRKVSSIQDTLNGDSGVKEYDPFSPFSSFPPLYYYRKQGIIKDIEELKKDIKLILKYLNVEKKYIREEVFLVKKPKQKK